MLKTPIWITNFKTYEQATGKRAVELAKIHQEVAEKMGVSIAIAVQASDLWRISQAVTIPVFAQHIDPVDFGSFTGHNLPQGVKANGAIGSLFNHSERRLPEDVLINTLACAQKASLIRIVCGENVDEIEQFAQYDPDFLAFEPPELIGSGSKSVATEEPESIAQAVKITSLPVLVGAGISTTQDVEVSLKLGAQGFLVASAICKAKNPKKVLTELVSVF